MTRCPACPVPSGSTCAAIATRCRRLCELAAQDVAYRDHILRLSTEPSLMPAGIALGRNVSGGSVDPWTFVRTERLAADTLRLVEHLPPDVDAVVGVARSGLVPATIVATRLHRPLWAASQRDGVTEVRSGNRPLGGAGAPRHVLVIDDTAARGGAMGGVVPRVRDRWPDAALTRAVVYAHPRGQHAVDLFWAEYGGAHFLEWNWQNAGPGQRCGFDFDGILCRDSQPGEFRLADIPPFYLPRRLLVPLIATGRREECRDASEAWLRRHGVRWARLEMRPESVPLHGPAIGAWKAQVYARSDCVLFAESDPAQAQTIAECTGKSVLCPALGRVIPPSTVHQPPSTEIAAVFSCPHRNHCRCSTVQCQGGKRNGQRVTLADCVECLG